MDTLSASHGMGMDKRRSGLAGFGSLNALKPFLAEQRHLIAAALVTLIVTAMLSLALPVAVRRIVDGFSAESARLVDQYFAAAIGIAALLAIGSGLRYYFVSLLGERVVADVRIAVFNRMTGMSPAYFEKVMTGEVLSRITTDTTLIQSVVGASASIALRNLLILSGGLALMVLTSARLAGFAVLLVPLVIMPILLLGRRVRRFSKESQERVAACSSMASETLLGVQTVQAFTHEPASRSKFARLAMDAFRFGRYRIAARTHMTVLVIFLVFSGTVGVLWIGAHDVRAGVMSSGQLVQFVIYSVMVAGSVAALSEVWGELQRAAGATERLAELLSAVDPVRDPMASASLPVNLKGNIRFDGVSFRYPSRQEYAALNELSFNVCPGETVALVGPSGAGKSTVFRLLLRFFDPERGGIILDGVDIRKAKRSELRKQLAYVPQEPVIFAASAMENIRFGRTDATDQEVMDAARMAAADEFLSELSHGYDTPVGERGTLLSGGQRQRIAIARAMLRNAPVLLLDEATSALDAESEQLVQQAVDRLAHGRTTLIVAHRLATVKRADRILVLEGGRVISEGTHGELVDKGGLYAKLASLQFTRGTS